MRKVIFDLAFIFLLFICGISFASDDFTVTFASQNVAAGHESTAVIECSNPNYLIEEIQLIEQYYTNAGMCQRGSMVTVQDDGKTITFKPLYNDLAWIEIKYKGQDGSLYIYKSDTINVTDGICIVANEPMSENYVYFGDSFTVEFTISGGNGEYTVKPYWWVTTSDSSFYYDYSAESHDSFVSISYKPTNQTKWFSWYVDVTDSNGASGTEQRSSAIYVVDDNLWSEPIYSWNDDYSQVTAICYYNLHVYEESFTYGFFVTETVNTSKMTIPATYEAPGKTVYTAVFTNTLFTTQIYEEVIPQLQLPTGPYNDATGNYNIIDSDNATFTKPAKSGATVTIPDKIMVNNQPVKVTAIGDNAFKKDKKLTTIKIGKHVRTIGKNTFNGCTKLKTIKGGDAISTIKDSAFKGCKAITKVTLSKNVKSIGKDAFNGCAALKTITVKTEKLTDKNVGKDAFKGISDKATFKCPKKKLKNYKKIFDKAGAPKTCKFK